MARRYAKGELNRSSAERIAPRSGKAATGGFSFARTKSVADAPSTTSCPPLAGAPSLAELFRLRSFGRLLLGATGGDAGQPDADGRRRLADVRPHRQRPGTSAWSACSSSCTTLVLTLPAGHTADRRNRGRIFAGCMLNQALVGFVLLLAIAGGHETWADPRVVHRARRRPRLPDAGAAASRCSCRRPCSAGRSRWPAAACRRRSSPGRRSAAHSTCSAPAPSIRCPPSCCSGQPA